MITFKSTTKTLTKPEKSFSNLLKDKPSHSHYEINPSAALCLQNITKGALPEAAQIDSTGTLFGFAKEVKYLGYKGVEQSYPVTPGNTFLEAVHTAFEKHYPLALSPDDFWLCITQGFAAHVKQNAEKLRSRFVAHEGKKKLIVYRDWFKGDTSNDWAGAFGEFSEQIKEHIGKTRDMLVADFSTTTVASRAASEVVLMDAMSQYFSYGMRTCCGIPEITLLGSVDDWKSVRNRAAVLVEYDLGEWGENLLPVLANVVESAKGNSKPEFWESFFHIGGGSGGPFVNGWINVLFPYLARGKNSYAFSPPRSGFYHGPNIGDFALGVSEVEMDWEAFVKVENGTVREMFDMTLASGFLAFSQEEDSQIIRPCIGWGVQDKLKAAK